MRISFAEAAIGAEQLARVTKLRNLVNVRPFFTKEDLTANGQWLGTLTKLRELARQLLRQNQHRMVVI